MERFKRFSLVASSLMLVLTLVTVLGTKQVHALVASMVQVVNSASNPVPNRDVDNPARQPFFFACAKTLDGTSSPVCIFPVPTGKRLVIENVSGLMLVPTGQKFLSDLVVTKPAGFVAGDPTFRAYYPSLFQMTLGTHDRYALNQTVRIYADPSGTDQDVTIIFLRDNDVGMAILRFNITGYLIPLP